MPLITIIAFAIAAILFLLIYVTGCVVAYGLLTDPELTPISRRRVWLNTIGSWITVLAFAQDEPTDNMLWVWLLALCLLAAAPDAWADSAIARRNGEWARITDRPCANEKVKAMAAMRGADPADLREGEAFLGGVLYPACWYRVPRYVQFFYEDGDSGLVDITLFSREPQV